MVGARRSAIDVPRSTSSQELSGRSLLDKRRTRTPPGLLEKGAKDAPEWLTVVRLHRTVARSGA
jgi:hypothetical protein